MLLLVLRFLGVSSNNLLQRECAIRAPESDARFAVDERFEEADAGPSSPGPAFSTRDDHDGEEAEGRSSSGSEGDNSGGEEEDDDRSSDYREGMDPAGFAGPSKRSTPKLVKTLTPEALAAFRAAQERTGVVYISRIPPGMRPTKVRHLMSQYGEIGRVYLQQEGECPFEHFMLGSSSSHDRSQKRISAAEVYVHKESALYRRMG